MGRYSENKAYGQSIRRIDHETYQLVWYVDRYYAGSRLRFPRQYVRNADEAGARRFCKKHGIEMPERPA